MVHERARARQHLLPQVRQPAGAQHERGCTESTSSGPSGAFKWRNVTGEQSKYGIELIPASGYSACLTTDQYSMINPEGNLQAPRITGRSRDETRTILATLRRQNFLDFIYFTHFETLDPAAYCDPGLGGHATARSTATSAAAAAPRSSSPTTTRCWARSTPTTTSLSAATPSSARSRATGSSSTGRRPVRRRGRLQRRPELRRDAGLPGRRARRCRRPTRSSRTSR